MIPILYADIIDDPIHLLRFEEIYESHRKQMMRTANAILMDEHEAEDAVQDAFIGIARNMKTVCKITDKNDLFYYLQTAAKNAALNRLSKTKIFQESVPIEKSWSISNDSFWQELCDKLDYESLVEIICGLPDIYQEALYFHIVMGFTIKETAALLQVKLTTAKQRLVRGKKILIDRIHQEGSFEHGIK